MLFKILFIFACGIVAVNSRTIYKRQSGGDMGMGGFSGGNMGGGAGGFVGMGSGALGGFGGGGFGGMGGLTERPIECAYHLCGIYNFGRGGVGGFIISNGHGYLQLDPGIFYSYDFQTPLKVPAFSENDDAVIEETDEIIKPDYVNASAIRVKAADPNYQKQSGQAENDPTQKPKKNKRWAKDIGYECCSAGNTEVLFSDEYGDWGIENGNWCGMVTAAAAAESKCWSEASGFPCCSTCTIYYQDETGKWGVENDNWCGIPDSC